MEAQKYKKDISNFLGLEYLTIKGVPMLKNQHGEFFDVEPLQLERIAAWVIIKHELPIRGKELKIIRGALDISLAKFARNFDKDAATIMNWEKKSKSRIAIADEILIRLFVADQMGIDLPNMGWKHIKELSSKTSEPLAVEYKVAG